MRKEQWEIIQKCARMEPVDPLPISLIVDSPWIPGYLGISMLDYYTIPEVWMEANLKIEAEYPEVIMLPGMWAEYGMCAEPSGFGCRVRFLEDKTPLAYPMLSSIDEIDALKQPDPTKDGLMPFVLNLYRYAAPRLKDQGHLIKVVAARGPMATASHVLGVTDFLLGLKLEPEKAHQFLKMTTRLTIEWLQAQAEALPDVEGVMVLDDLVGFLSPKDYEEFGHPYFKEIFQAFPGMVRMFHNDTDNPVSYPYLKDWPVDIFNFTFKYGVDEVREQVGPDVCLMGNLGPLNVLASATPEEVRGMVDWIRKAHPGPGLILSAGGGVSPGTPGENIRAMIEAARA